MNLRDGTYLVGRWDGAVDPFLARVTGSEVLHYVGVMIEDAIENADDKWWWRWLEVPQNSPSEAWLDAIPPNPVERGGL